MQAISKILFFALLFCLGASPVVRATAQEVDVLADEPFREISARLESSVRKYINYGLLEGPEQEKSLAPLAALLSLPVPDNGKEGEVLRAERQHLLKDYGLSVSGGYLENLKQGVIGAEGIYYKRRGRLELAWDVLHGGFLENRYEARRLSNELELLTYRQRLEARENRYSRLYNRIIQQFNIRKIPLLEAQIAVLGDLLNVTSTLYEDDYAQWDEVLAITSQHAQAELRLKTYRDYNAQFNFQISGVAAGATFPVAAIDVGALEECLSEAGLPQQVLALQAENLSLRYNELLDISLSPYVRYNLYHSPGEATGRSLREYFSVGVSFSAPLSLPFLSNQSIVQARLHEFQQQAEERSYNIRKEVYNHYYEYQYSLKQYIGFYEKLLRLRTHIRDEMSEKALDAGYSPVEVLSQLDLLMRVELELLDIKQKLYLKLLKITTLLPCRDVTAIVEPVQIHEWVAPEVAAPSLASLPEKRLEKSHRAIYIWSSTFAANENESLLEYLTHEDFDKVFLSLGDEKTLLNKGKAFTTRAHEKGIAVLLLVGNNYLFEPENRDRIAEAAAVAEALGARGVHLDTEPHTFADWDENRTQYMVAYVDMLRQARRITAAHDLILGVSIPVFYRQEVLREIFRLVDEVTVMAYGATDTSYVERKLKEELSINKDKIRIAVRAEDFDSQEALNAFLDRVMEATGAQHFAIHDLAEVRI